MLTISCLSGKIMNTFLLLQVVVAAVSTAMDKIHRSINMKETGVKDILTEERVERVAVGSEEAVVFMETTRELELAAVEVTLGEVEVLMRIFPVGEGEDLLTMEQIRKTNVVTTALDMVM